MASALSAALGVIATGGVSMVVFAGKTPDREEVQEMIEERTPYLRDRGVILDNLDRIPAIQQDLAEIKESLIRLEARGGG